MADFIHAAAYSHPSAQLQHLRSISSTNSIKTTPKPHARPISKSSSVSALRTMAAVSNAPAIPPHRLSSYNDEDRDMSTIPDPRSRSMTPAHDSSPSSPSHHPDLSNEVASLSNKLINAINHQTNLDDTLSATRQELEASRERVRVLERENSEHAELVSRGILIRKSIADNEKAKLVATIAEERRQKGGIEKEKKHIEQELENLSVALFEEAQKMVVTAREDAQKDHDIVQRRNDQLKAQLADAESLLKSQQEQLTELKRVMEQMTEERDDQINPTAPSTPGLSKFDSREDSQDRDAIRPASISETVQPTYPTSFTHLIHTVLRTDLSSFEDFTSLLRMSKNIPSGSRVSSGSYGAIGLGLGLGGYAPHPAPNNGSTSSLSTSGTLGSAPVTPTTPASTASNGSANGPNSLTPLKETKFYKRALAEDIEPTLRLDTAPGLSWLARRTVLNAVCEGTLVVEPMPSSTKNFVFACSLCGETRKDEAHTRSHRFRTSENDNAQKYPLCKYCLGRVRSTCDFLGLLRILKEGHWRADDEESEKAAWEESVRLREQMFWCRMGGGCVPAQQSHVDPSRSPRISEDERKEQERKLSEELERTGEIQPKDVTPVLNAAKRDSVRSISKLVVEEETTEVPESRDNVVEPSSVDHPSKQGEPVKESIKDPDDLENTVKKHDATRDSTRSTSSLQISSPGGGERDEAKRLSISIPGSLQ